LITGRGNPTVSLLSQSLAFSIPAFLGIYWPLYIWAPTVVPMALRCGILSSSLALLIFWYRAPLTRVETNFLLLFGAFFVALVVPSLTATDVPRAFTDVLKLALLCGIGLVLARSLRDARTAKAFGYGMLLGSIAPTLQIVIVYVKHLGLTVPTYEHLRLLKGLVSKHEGIALNPIAFTALFMYIVGLCLVRRTKLIWGLGAFVFLVSATLTGSRAPAAIAVLSFYVFLTWSSLQSKSLFVRVSGLLVFVAVSASAMGTVLALDADKLASITEGRSDLCRVAWSKFMQRPISGFGYESWRDDLVSLLPGKYVNLTAQIATRNAGSYHNQYLTILAEEGLIAFIPAVAIIWTLLKYCHWLATYKLISATNGRLIMMACLFMLLRAGVEVPGLFGYSQEPADYLAYCFLAVVISQASNQQAAVLVAAATRIFSRPILHSPATTVEA